MTFRSNTDTTSTSTVLIRGSLPGIIADTPIHPDAPGGGDGGDPLHILLARGSDKKEVIPSGQMSC